MPLPEAIAVGSLFTIGVMVVIIAVLHGIGLFDDL